MAIPGPANPPSSPRRAALLVMPAVLTGMTIAGAAPPGAQSVYSRATTTAGERADLGAAADPQGADAQAERIVASSLAMLAQADSVSARLRQKVRVGNRVLVGTGRYLQSGRGEDQRYRFESTLTCDTETFELVEVCDGVFGWTYRHYGTEQPQVQRLDVRRIREKLVLLQASDPASATAYLGGLQRSLACLRQWFRFVAAASAETEGLPIWVVEGHWNPDWVRVILPDLPDVAESARQPGGIQPTQLPDGVPWSVRFCIGRGDLVPYRIEWLALPGPRPVAPGVPEPIAVLELQDVRIGGPVDAGAFVYKPAAEGLIDLTDAHVKGMSLFRP